MKYWALFFVLFVPRFQCARCRTLRTNLKPSQPAPPSSQT